MLLRRSTDIYPKELARDMREFFSSLLGTGEGKPPAVLCKREIFMRPVSPQMALPCFAGVHYYRFRTLMRERPTAVSLITLLVRWPDHQVLLPLATRRRGDSSDALCPCETMQRKDASREHADRQRGSVATQRARSRGGHDASAAHASPCGSPAMPPSRVLPSAALDCAND